MERPPFLVLFIVNEGCPSLLFLFGMALGAGRGCFFCFGLFVEFFMTVLAVIVQGLGMILQPLFFLQLGCIRSLGSFTGNLMAFNAALNSVAGLQHQWFPICVMVAFTATGFEKVRVGCGIRFRMLLV